MKQASYLWKNQRGIYFFRARIPKQFIEHFGTSQIKKTLKTDSYRLAVKLARAYRVELDKEMTKLEKGEYGAFTVRLECETKTNVTLPNGEKDVKTGKSEWNVTEERARELMQVDDGHRINREDRRYLAEQIEERARKDELHKAQLAAIVSAPQTTQQKPSNVRSVPLSQVIAEYEKNKVARGEWEQDPKSSTHSQKMARLMLILDIVGDKLSTELSGIDAIRVEETLPLIPKNQNQGELAKLPNLQAKIDTDAAKYPRLGKQTQAKHWELFKSLMKFAKQKRYIEHDICQDCVGVTFTKKETKESGWKHFTDDELQKIFNGYVYQSVKPSRINKNHDYYFWLPLLAAFTGARINELSQLLLTDIKQYKDIWYLDITDEDEHERKVDKKSVKTEAGKRKVPIHSKLIELGFLDFIKQPRTGVNADMVFSEGLSLKGGRWGGNSSRWFNDKVSGYKVRCGIPPSDDRKVFHSFRKSFASNMINHVAVERLAQIIGHEQEYKMTFKYAGEIDLPTIKEAIEKLDYKIDLSHVSYETFKTFK